MIQKSLLAALLLHGLQPPDQQHPHGCHAFVSKHPRASLRPRTTRSTSFSLPKVTIASNPPRSIVETQETDADSSDLVALELVKSEEPTKETLLDSISRTSPDELFGEDSIIETDDAKDLILGDLIEDVAAAAAAEANSSPPTPDLVVDRSRNEDVQAILAASGQAVAEAEASMPPELKEQFQFSNATSSATTTTTPRPLQIISETAVPDILTAASVVGEPVAITQNKMQAPKVSKILKFAIPAIGVWLCGPLLSLIDTSAVGLFSGTVQQAALSPAVAVTDYAALLIAFMYTGATNLVAAAQEADRGTPNKPATTRVLIGSMQLSTYVGAGLGMILFVFARPLLRAIIGNDGISPAVFAAAMKYVRIRAIGMPAAAIIGSTQAACLGMQDIRSPLYVLAAAAVVNFFGDVLFVRNPNPWIGGAAGAAWATVISQYVGLFFFIKWLMHKSTAAAPRVMNVSNAILEMTGTPSSKGNSRRQQLRDALQTFGINTNNNKDTASSVPRKAGTSSSMIKKIFNRPKKVVTKKTAPKEDSFTVKGFLADRFSFRDLLKLPSAETRKDFGPYLAPVTATQVGRVSGYIAMSHVVASSLGTVSMAAQQIIVSLFYCLCPIADSLSLTAQSFLPSISEKAPSREKSAALRKTALNFVKAGGIFGGAMVAAVAMIPLLSGMFTSDPAVIGLVNSVVPLLLAFFSVHGVLCASEGVLLGQKDLGFLGKMYGMFFAVVPYFLLKLKKAALTGSRPVNLASVWTVFLGYQMFRCAAWVGRVVMLQRRTEKASSQLAPTTAEETLSFSPSP